MMLKTQVIPPASLPAYLQPGEIIAERYRLERELGRGSMGTVWSAVHVTLGQRVAIKLIAAEHVESPEARLRFSNEAKAAARLKSRHVVQVYDDGQTDEGMPYIVMEYLDGETLEEKIDRTGDLPLAEAVRITSHVGRALARAHAQGIIHRDLKPANIFLSKSEDDELGWIAKVLDFGVAKLTGQGDASQTKTGTLVGTPLFMSPEQIRGASHVDQRADLYSLGMVFYNMVSGKFAFDAPSYSDVLIHICMSPLPDLKEVAPWIPDAVRSWYVKACARDAGERFQSADEMVEALHHAAGRASRPERASAPDEVIGPSGTVVGYSGPEIGPGTTLALSADQGPPTARAGARQVPPAVAPAPISNPVAVRQVPPTQESPPWTANAAARPHDPQTQGSNVGGGRRQQRALWPLFLAAGAGLGLALAGGGVLFMLARPNGDRAAPQRNVAASAAPPPLTATALAASPPLPPPALTPSNAPATGTPSAPPSVATAAPRAAVHTKTTRASTATRPTSTARTTPPPAKTPPKGGTPDIGF